MSPDARAETRMPHLDNLRTILVAWVIGGHALLGYSAVGGWAYDEFHEVTFAPPTELVLVAIIGPSGLFVIGLFFFIAGLLAERAVSRRGPAATSATGRVGSACPGSCRPCSSGPPRYGSSQPRPVATSRSGGC